MITVSRDRLTIEESTLFGTRRREWPREKLAAVGLAGAEILRPRLLIDSPGQPALELLGYRKRAELAWISRIIREKLAVAQPQRQSGT